MSLDVAYMRRSVGAAVALALRDERAWTRFDLTVDGFFRSFAAFFLVAPISVLIDLYVVRLGNARRAATGLPLPSHVYGLDDAVFWTIALAAQWLVFPIAMIFLLRFLGLSQRYSALVIAHNWGTVIVTLLYLPAVVLFSSGLISWDQAYNINFIVLGLTLYYRYYIAQTALGAGWSVAAGVTLLYFILQIYFEKAVVQLADLWLAAS